MNAKTVLITGANSGIGKETAAALAKRGATVVMTARDAERGERAVREVRHRAGHDRVSLLIADFASLAEVHSLAERFRAEHQQLDVLINNAGLMQSRRSLSEDGYEMTFAVNHLSSFALTHHLLGLLQKSAPARIVNVASLAHTRGEIDFEDLQSERNYDGFAVYSNSKLANILFTFELARRLEGSGVTANCLHPGVVRTGFGLDGDARGIFRLGVLLARPFFLSARKGARTTIHLASSPDVEKVTGEYFDKCKVARTAARARDPETARRLWSVSEQLTGLESQDYLPSS